MNENAKAPKKVITYVEPVITPESNDVVTHIGFKKGVDTKYGVVFPIFTKSDGSVDYEKMAARYNMTEMDLIASGVRQISTRPVYDAAFAEDGSCDQIKLQEIADGYKPGSRVAAEKKPVSVEKAKAKVAEKSGLTAEELAEAIAAARAKKGLV